MGMPFLLLRILAWMIGGALILLVLGTIYEHVSRVLGEKKYPPPGEFSDAGGHQLHYVKKGNSGPTVVFESGLDFGGHLPWMEVQEKISANAVTVSYDRAGILWSERGNNPKTCKAMASELHTMLNNAGVKKPYILVGHSLGGLILRSFVSRYADDVSGIVLVDCSHPLQMQTGQFSEETKKLNEIGMKKLRFLAHMAKFMYGSGIMRILKKGGDYDYKNEDVKKILHPLLNAIEYKSISAGVEELDNLESLHDEVAHIKSFGDIPVLVLRHGKEEDEADSDKASKKISKAGRKEIEDFQMFLRKDVLSLSTDIREIVASKSGHYIQFDQPDLVVNAIEEIIEKVRLSEKSNYEICAQRRPGTC